MSDIKAPDPAAPPQTIEHPREGERGTASRANGAPAGRKALSADDLRAIENLVTEDDTPVDNLFSEKQRRLLTHPLYASWAGSAGGRPFLVASDVGVFRSPQEPPLVPDVFLSLDVVPPDDWWERPNRVYAIWQYEKPPDVVIEVVSNNEGGEKGDKLLGYAHFGVPYYVVFDPQRRVQDGLLEIYELFSGVYASHRSLFLPRTGLGLQLWQGSFEGRVDTWLRWIDVNGTLIKTGEEYAGEERRRAVQAETRAKQAEARAEQAEARAERLAAQLQSLGIAPENGNRPSD